MHKSDLEKANELNYDLRRKEEKYNEMLLWKSEQEKTLEKGLSLSNIGHGWITIPGDKKQEVLNLIHDITLKEFKDAEKRFKAFQPRHRDKL